MLFSQKMRIYTVHINPSLPHPMEKAVFIHEGFNFFAFVFGVFWALYHRLWSLAFILAAVIFLFGIADHMKLLDNASLLVLQLTSDVVVGMWANNWYRAILTRRGYITSDIVVSDSELRAKQRYFDNALPA
jgi:hypothetical protein